jgi:hypothetical protein
VKDWQGEERIKAELRELTKQTRKLREELHSLVRASAPRPPRALINSEAPEQAPDNAAEHRRRPRKNPVAVHDRCVATASLTKRREIGRRMIYFFRRAGDALTCETRLNPMGAGYELVVTERGEQRIEAFATVGNMLAREHELLQVWRAQGWQDIGPAKSHVADPDDWNI